MAARPGRWARSESAPSRTDASTPLLASEHSERTVTARLSWLQAWLAWLWTDVLSVELVNKQSVARDHLANERTYLAWLRTSLSFASAGVAVTQLLRLDTSRDSSPDAQRSLQRLRRLGKPAGATLISIAMLVIVGGAWRYFIVQQALRRDRFPISRLLVASVAGLSISFLVISFLVMLVFNPTAM